MARNLSWIDNDKLSALLNVVGPARAPAEPPAGAPRMPVPRRPAPPVTAAPAAAQRAVAPAAPRPVPPGGRGPVMPARAPQRPAPAAAEPAPAAAASTGPAAAPAAPAAAEQTPAAEPGPAPAAAPAEPGPEPFRATSADLAARMDEYLDWVVAWARVKGVVIADSQGLVVVQRHATEREAALGIAVEQLLCSLGELLDGDAPADASAPAVDGHLVLQRGEQHLVTLWTATEHGRLFGVLAGDAMPRTDVLALAAQGFRAVFAS